MATKKSSKQEQDQPQMAEDQVASLPQSVSGPAAVRYSVAQIAGINVSTLGDDDSISWYANLVKQAASQGWHINRELATVSIKTKHVGLFNAGGTLQAAVFQGDEVVTNPTSENVAVSRLTQRLRVTKAKPAEDTIESEK